MWFRIGLASLLVVLPGSAVAAPAKVRVRGAAKLVAHASRDQVSPDVNELVLAGSLTDDAGQPLALQSITARVARESDPRDAKVAEGLRGAHGCDRAAEGGREGAPRRGPTAWGVRVAGPTDEPEIILVTDEDGRFCFRARLEPDRFKANLVFAPGSGTLVDGTEREIVFDLTKRSLALRFDPTPRIVPLDLPRASLEAVAILDDDANPRVAPALTIVLANEKEEIARAVTDATGRARFYVAGSKLGPPGPGELRLSFAGDGETARAATTEEVERHVKVSLRVPGELSPANPEDGILLGAEVSSALGPIGEGSVEARIGEVVVGTAPVERGLARLLLTFTMAQSGEAIVRLRYVPTSPWYEPLSEPEIRIPVRGPSLLSKLPILAGGLAVLAFFLFGRVTAQKNKPEPRLAEPKNNGDPIERKPGIEVVRAAQRGEEGWSGRVVDAHDGTPVARARVWIERGTFEGRTVLATTDTDAEGAFHLPGIGPVNADERIIAEARLHARLVQDLPAPGEISIALGQRRRVLLARMVAWAKRRGPPFDLRPEPTPGHIRRVAGADVQAAEWASAVEQAAFGPGEVDVLAEQKVDRLAPDDRASALPQNPLKK